MDKLYNMFLNDLLEPKIIEEFFPVPNRIDRFIILREIYEKSYVCDKIDFTLNDINTNINLRVTIQLGICPNKKDTSSVEFTTVEQLIVTDFLKVPSLTSRGILMSGQLYFTKYCNEIVKGITYHENSVTEEEKNLIQLNLRSDNYRNISFKVSDDKIICKRKNKYTSKEMSFDFYKLLRIFNENEADNFLSENSATSISNYDKSSISYEDLIQEFLSWIGKDYQTLDNIVNNTRKEQYVKNGLYFKFEEETLKNMRHFLSFENRIKGAVIWEDINTKIEEVNTEIIKINFNKGKILKSEDLILLDKCKDITSLIVKINNKIFRVIKKPITNTLDINMLANIFNIMDTLRYIKNIEANESNFLYQRASTYYSVMMKFVDDNVSEYSKKLNKHIYDCVKNCYNSLENYQKKVIDENVVFNCLYENMSNHLFLKERMQKEYKYPIKFFDKYKDNPDMYKLISLADNRNSRIAYANKNIFINPSKEVSIKAKEIQATHMFFLCSISAPESDKAGATKHLTVGTFVDKYGVFRNSFVNLITGETEYLSALDIYTKKVAVEDFDNKVSAKVLYRGEIIETEVSKIEYKPKSWSQISSINIASGICGTFNKSRRQLMENNELNQTLTILGGEPTSLNTGLDSKYLQDYCITVKDILLYNEMDLTVLPENVVLIFKSIKDITKSNIDIKNKQIIEYIFEIKELIENENIDLDMNNIIEVDTNEKEYLEEQFNPIKGKRILKYPIMKNYLQAQQNITLKMVNKNIFHLNDIVFIPEDAEYMEEEQTQVFEDIDTSSKHLRLSIGKNVTIAYMNYEGYCYEDGMVIREGLANSLGLSHVYTKTESYELELNEVFIAKEPLGTKVYPGMILGSIFNNEGVLIKNIIVPRDKEGIFSFYELKNNILTLTITGIYFVEVSCKFAGFHGNKCTVCAIIPDDKMPLDPDTLIPVDICLNPLGITTRDNMGQLIEGNLNLIGEKDAIAYKISVDSLNNAKALDTNKILIDGRTGTPFRTKVNVIRSSFIQLDHHAKDKLRTSLLPTAIDLVSNQIKKGDNNEGGCGISELTTNALLASGANQTLDYLKMIGEGAGNKTVGSFAEYLIKSAKYEMKDILKSSNTNRFQKYLVYLYGSAGLMYNYNNSTASIEVLTNDSIEATFKNINSDKAFNNEVYLTSTSTNNLINVYLGIDSEKYMKDIVRIEVPGVCWLNPAIIYTQIFKDINKNYGISPQDLIDENIYIRLEEMSSENEEVNFDIQILKKGENAIPEDFITGAYALMQMINKLDTDAYKYLINNFVLIPREFRKKNKEKYAEADINKAYSYLLKRLRDVLIYFKETSNINNSLEEGFNNIINTNNKEAIKAYNLFYKEYFNYFTSKTRKSVNEDFLKVRPYLDYLSDKEIGVYRSMLLAKRVASSMGSVIVGDPYIKLDEVGVPFLSLVDLYRYEIYYNLFSSEALFSDKYEPLRDFLKPYIDIIKYVKDLEGHNVGYDIVKTTDLFDIFCNRLKSIVYRNIYYKDDIYNTQFKSYTELEKIRNLLKDFVQKICNTKINILIREPVLHRFNVEGFKPVIVEGYALHINTLICKTYNADFDGDNMQNISILPENVVNEVKDKLTPYQMFFDDSGNYNYPLVQDVLYGLCVGIGCLNIPNEKSIEYENFNILDFKNHKYNLNDLINSDIKTTVGKYYFLEKISDKFNIPRKELFKILEENFKDINKIITLIEQKVNNKVELFNDLKLISFEFMMQEPVTLSLKDMIDISNVWEAIKEKSTEKENNLLYSTILLNHHFFNFKDISREDKLSEIQNDISDIQYKYLENTLKQSEYKERLKDNNFMKIVNTGAKGKLITLHDLIIGGSQPVGIRGNNSPARISTPTLSGLKPYEVFQSGYTSLTSQYSTNESTKDAGELSRSFSTGLSRKIMDDDCGAKPTLHDLYMEIPFSNFTSLKFKEYEGKLFEPNIIVKDVVSKNKITNLSQGMVFGSTLISSNLKPIFEDLRLDKIYAKGIKEPFNFIWEISDLSYQLYEGRYGYDLNFDNTVNKDKEVLLTKEIIKKYFDAGYKQIYVRTLYDCVHNQGICSKCFGVTLNYKENPNTMKFYKINTEIGKIIATQISQRLTQAKMDKKNKSIHEEEVDTIQQFNILLNLSDKSVKTPTSLRAPERYFVGFENKITGEINLCNSKYKVNDLLLDKQTRPPVGFKVTNGNENFKRLSKLVNIDKFRYLLLLEYYNLYKENNLIIDPRCFELLVAIQTSMVRILKNNIVDINGNHTEKKFYVNSYRPLSHAKKYIDKNQLEVEIEPLSLSKVLAYRSPLTALGFSHISFMLKNIISNKVTIDLRDNIELLNGGLFLTKFNTPTYEQKRYKKYKDELMKGDKYNKTKDIEKSDRDLTSTVEENSDIIKNVKETKIDVNLGVNEEETSLFN